MTIHNILNTALKEFHFFHRNGLSEGASMTVAAKKLSTLTGWTVDAAYNVVASRLRLQK